MNLPAPPDLAAVRAFLGPEHQAWASHVRAFADRELRMRPEAPDDASARVQARDLLHVMGDAGLYAPIGSADLRGCCLTREALAAASPLADAVWALQGLGITAVLLSGDDGLRERWAEPALSGALMSAFALTEPDAGSDVGAIGTTAVRDGGDYVLEGTKWFISNAGIADYYVVFASTDPHAGKRGITALLVPGDSPGLVFGGAQVLSSPHPLGVLEFEGCRIPATHRIGGEGQGFKIAMATLDRLRPTVGAAACGMAGRALAEAVAHALERKQFGQPLADFQLVQDKLGRMAIELTASRLLVYRAAWEKDGGAERITSEAAMAKAHATETAQRVIDDAIQILGGRGVLAEHVLDRMYRSIRAMRIYEGTTEIQHMIVAGGLIAAAKESP
jgi:acyl-CoA dehydrogenase